METLFYTGLALDRGQALRRDADGLVALAADPAIGVVPVWRGKSAVAGSPPRAVLLSGVAAQAALARAPEALFLGLDGARPLFAADLSAEDEPGLGPAVRLAGLRFEAPLLPAAEVGLLGLARALVLWHGRQRFCGACGAPTRSVEGGHSRLCSAPACATQTYPRTDPAVIMLVEDQDRLLLHRQPGWAPGMWSCLAGFVEAGETLEEAVAREVREETGIEVADIRYVASQPWPYPSSLMVAFTARATGGTLVPDGHELEDARWFGRDELAAFDDGHRDTGQGLFLARRGTVARLLIEGWLIGRNVGSVP